MPSRRAFLQGSSLATLAACAPSAGGDPEGADTGGGDTYSLDKPVETNPEAELDPIVSNADFYHVTYGGQQPDEAWIATWMLTLTNVAGDSVSLDVDALRAMGGETFERTISCIGSTSGVTTGNAQWSGVRLSVVLDTLGLARDGDWLWVECGDGYSTCLPASDIDAGLVLVHGMNGVDLPIDHGAPLRLLVPGRYGMKNPKWVTKLAFLPAYLDGLWEARGWSATAEYQVASWVVSPASHSQVPSSGLLVLGSAFAGEHGIVKVELSVDQGETWSEAEITYAGGPGVWTLWRWWWVPPALGEYLIVVRATNGRGEVQTEREIYDEDLDGFEGLDFVAVEVV